MRESEPIVTVSGLLGTQVGARAAPVRMQPPAAGRQAPAGTHAVIGGAKAQRTAQEQERRHVVLGPRTGVRGRVSPSGAVSPISTLGLEMPAARRPA